MAEILPIRRKTLFNQSIITNNAVYRDSWRQNAIDKLFAVQCRNIFSTILFVTSGSSLYCVIRVKIRRRKAERVLRATTVLGSSFQFYLQSPLIKALVNILNRLFTVFRHFACPFFCPSINFTSFDFSAQQHIIQPMCERHLRLFK